MAANKPERVAHGNAIPEERYAAARVLYESTPGMTMKAVAEETGIGKSTLERRANEEGWKKNYAAKALPPMTDAAHAIADRYNGKLEEYGPEITDQQRQDVVADTVVEVALDLRGQLLERHRKEWAAPRKLAYEAMQRRDFELAKLAKISSETLKIVQDGERKAWGIDRGEGDDKKMTLVIERGDE